MGDKFVSNHTIVWYKMINAALSTNKTLVTCSYFIETRKYIKKTII